MPNCRDFKNVITLQRANVIPTQNINYSFTLTINASPKRPQCVYSTMYSRRKSRTVGQCVHEQSRAVSADMTR